MQELIIGILGGVITELGFRVADYFQKKNPYIVQLGQKVKHFAFLNA